MVECEQFVLTMFCLKVTAAIPKVKEAYICLIFFSHNHITCFNKNILADLTSLLFSDILNQSNNITSYGREQ